jgi:hypothetical protein
MPPKPQSAGAIPNKFTRAETESYFARSIALMRPFRMRIAGAAIFAVTVIAVYVKRTVEGSTWIYAAVNAAMIVVGTGLVALSTAMMVHDQRSQRTQDDFRPAPERTTESHPSRKASTTLKDRGEGVRP